MLKARTPSDCCFLLLQYLWVSRPGPDGLWRGIVHVGQAAGSIKEDTQPAMWCYTVKHSFANKEADSKSVDACRARGSLAAHSDTCEACQAG